MRLPESLLVIACGTFLLTTDAFAAAAENGSATEQSEPYHKHEDRRHGHNHFYPDRGSLARELPHGAVVVNYAGVSYRFYDGIWFEPRGPAYMVVTPPIGLIVPTVPSFATVVDARGEPYLYANDVYYRARPDLGGYEIVNDPADTTAPPREIAAGAGATASGSAQRATNATPDTASAAQPTPAVVPTSVPRSAVPRPVASPQTAPAVAAAVPAVVAPASAAVPTQISPPTYTAPVPAAAPTAMYAPPSASAPAPQPTAPAPQPTAPAPQPPAQPLQPPQTTPQAALPSAQAAPPAVQTQPPSVAQPVLASGSARAVAVPRIAKSQDEQARDHYDCYRFAVAQSGYDPMRTNAPSTQAAGEAEYERAQAACFEARGYALR